MTGTAQRCWNIFTFSSSPHQEPDREGVGHPETPLPGDQACLPGKGPEGDQGGQEGAGRGREGQ